MEEKMAEKQTEKYVRPFGYRKSGFKEVKAPIPFTASDETFGNMGFEIYWQTIETPLIVGAETHRHDFPQFLFFMGGDVTKPMELNAVIEMTLSEDGKTMEKHIITRPTVIYIRPGLFHCPLVIKEVTKPIFSGDLFFAKKYEMIFDH
jgi:hypothetical protein